MRWLGVVGGSIVLAQANFTISGYVRDKNSREALAGAKIIVAERGTGVVTNPYGYYALRLPEGRHKLIAQFVGYQSDTLTLYLKADTKHDFFLVEEGVELQTVEIAETYEQQRFETAAMSENRIDVQQLKKLPAFFGEVDIFRSLSFLPGVATAGDGSGAFFVRGGSFDQNLVLLDEATVYNPGHLGGIFAAFNSDALQEAKIYKGYMPAEYGGRLSSVLDVRLREGNSPRWTAAGGIGLISSRLNVEGPLLKDKAGLLLTARRSYADLFLLFTRDPELRQTALYFYDLTAKLNYSISDKHRIYLSGYFGRDVFKNSFLDFNWGNATTTLRWNFIPSPRLFLNTLVFYSKYDYAFIVESGRNQARFSSGIEDIGWRTDADYYLTEKIKFRFGASITRHTFLPGRLEPTSDTSNLRSYSVPSLRGAEAAIYLQTGYKFSARWLVEGGLRWAGFGLFGPATLYALSPERTVNDTLSYGSGRLIDAWGGLEPRLSIRYALSDQWALKVASGRVQQFIHVATLSPIGLPTDIWWPTTLNVRRQDGYQVALALQGTPRWKGHSWDISWEIFYREMRNVVDFRSGTDIFLNPRLEADLVQGRGWAYGSEWMLQKLTGKLTGWISYTYSRSFRYIPEITDRPFPNYIDRPHQATLVIQYPITARWELGITGIYATGRPITLPVAKYIYDGQVIGVYNERNNRRMPDYHRMDISLTWTAPRREGRRWRSSWNFSVYNLYGRRNMWALRLRRDENNPDLQRAYKFYFFRWVPAITYNFQF
ncbi:MAG: TonB-dependent receptor [Bacteroidia bacterium]|nr:TonB-dependent receptor [Bacteroidia bacterium]MCX7651393.1 TonB-dependent receptor [Bacteroidia bacterium]MDW8416707.1 TonB-dependent receptor [Bacteroidia bacterium]